MKLTFFLLILGALSSCAAFEIEPNDTLATANPIVPGQPTTGQLSSAPDQDWFGFSMSSAGTVIITFDSPEDVSGAAFGYQTIQVRDSSNTLLASVNIGNDTSFQTGLPESGTYYVVVRDGPFSTLSTGQYVLTISTGSVQTPVESEPNNTPAQAIPLPLGQKTHGQLLSQTDEDWFSLTTASSGTITVAFESPENIAGAAFGYHTIQVRNTEGTIFASVDSGEDKTFQAGVPSADTYFVVVRDGPFSTLSSSQYGLTVTTSSAIPPAIVSAQIYSSVEVVWNTTVGKSYIVEWTTDLDNPSWFPLTSNLAGNGGEMSFLASTRGKTKGFYRVMEN